jgi:hypothetical protein
MSVRGHGMAPQPRQESALAGAEAQAGATTCAAGAVYWPEVIVALAFCWAVLGAPTGKRLAPIMAEWCPGCGGSMGC